MQTELRIQLTLGGEVILDSSGGPSVYKWKEAEEKGPERWQRLDKPLLAQKMEDGYEPKNDSSL